MNKTQGVELEIRKDDGSTIMVVQKQGNTRFSAGQRVVLASNGSQVTVSTLIKTGCGYQATSLYNIYHFHEYIYKIYSPRPLFNFHRILF